MKKLSLFTWTVLLILTGIGLFFTLNPSDQKPMPPPQTGTQIKSDMEEGENRDLRQKWFRAMHQAAPGVDWQDIEYRTSRERQNRHPMLSRPQRNLGDEETLADGALTGKWIERGSKNQAGSVFDVEYDVETNQLYLISAGGSLFTADYYFQYWEVLNDRYRFTPGLLRLIRMPDGNKRMITLIQHRPHFSDDMGLSWEPAISYTADGWANVKDAFVTEYEGIPHIFILMKTSYWNNYQLYVSRDYGLSFQSIRTFYTYDGDNLAMTHIKKTADIFLIEQINEQTTRLFTYDPGTGKLALVRTNSPLGFGESGQGNLAGALTAEKEITLLSYDGDQRLYSSLDTGKTWTFQSTLPISPWEVRLFISEHNPDLLLIGAVECYRSLNRGKGWSLINSWAEYYGDVQRKLHADIMQFDEFIDSEGEPFVTISNHGGLSASYDLTLTNQNIGLYDLNVSQYYSVRTSPKDENFVTAGSQDQGLQRGKIHGEQTANLEQVISGDYGHNVFTKGGDRFWTVYPGGWVSHYSNPELGYLDASWELQSDNETVWIPPMIAGPDPEKDEIIMAGGSIYGGPGSYLIRLEYKNGNIQRLQLPFNFLQASSSEISAIAISPMDPNRWYVATNSGQFFYSDDGGIQFQQGALEVPGSHYLYGACILPSSVDPDVVYISGSGYSTAPVLKSVDGGKHFSDMSEGMPQTLAFALATNEEESLIFAATEAGPWVYLKQENRWYDMAGATAPTQSYWSVEYLKESKTARFGTYGRGIWDFSISENATVVHGASENATDLHVYPNPTEKEVWIDLSGFDTSLPISLKLTDYRGVTHLSEQVNTISEKHHWDISDLDSGIYFITAKQAGNQAIVKLIKP